MLDTEYERALGLMLLTAGELEVDLDLLAWQLIGREPEVGEVITRRLSVTQTTDLLVRLTELQRADLYEQIRSVINQVRLLMDRRNELVHATWEEANADGISVLAVRRGRTTSRTFNPKDIDQLTREIAATRETILLLIGEVTSQKTQLAPRDEPNLA